MFLNVLSSVGIFGYLCSVTCESSISTIDSRVGADIRDISSCMIIAGYPDAYMNLWLKEEGFSVAQINQLPTVTYAINIVASWLGTTLAAIYPAWTIYTGATTCLVFSNICMIIWTIPKPLKYVSIIRIIHTFLYVLI